MTYSIRKSDGSLLIDLTDGNVDTSKTSLTLIGKNVSEFGQRQNENFVHLLENFASVTKPDVALVGQLWFNKATQQLHVNTAQGFQSIGPFPDPTIPNNATKNYINQLFPVGVIMIWYGALNSIPQGWALCDGSTINGVATPDLRDRFVMGAGNATPGSFGGNKYISQVAAHSHAFDVTSSNNLTDHTHGGVTNAAGLHKHVFPGDDQLYNADGVAGWTADSVAGFNYDARSVLGGGGRLWQTTAAGSHNHSFNTGGQSATHQHEVSGETSTVGLGEVDVTNPYLALAYIIKVA